jgi:peroxiredoxin
LNIERAREGGNSMSAQGTPSIEIGSTVPDFRRKAGSGKEVDIREYRERSNVVLFFVREFN